MTPPDVDDVKALDDLGATLTDLAEAVARLSDDVPAALDVDDSSEAVVRLLADLREQRKQLAEMEAYVEAAAVKRLKYGQQQVGDFIAEVKGGKDRKAWRHDDLAWAVCRPLAVNENTGEVVTEIAEIIDQVRSRLLNCAAVSYWRTTQLKPLGINPDDYSESTPGRRTVTVTSAIEAEPATDRVAS
jgi:hypothetical protein